MTAETNNILPIPFTQFLNLAGAVLAGGQVFTYAADGATPKATYQNASGTVANTNPVVLNSSGQAQIWGQGTYVFTVYDSGGNQQYSYPTQDPCAALNVSAAMLPVIQASTIAAALALLGITATPGNSPYGTLIAYAGTAAPSGYALCYGQAVSRTLYPNLFSAIGTTWGIGDGSTTFNLPDLRGRTVAGADAMGGSASGNLTTAVAGFNANAAVGTTGGGQYIASHTHGITDPGHAHTLNAVLDNTGSTGPITGGFTTAVGIHSNPTSTATTGITVNIFGGGSTGNVQPTGIVNWIIALG